MNSKNLILLFFIAVALVLIFFSQIKTPKKLVRLDAPTSTIAVETKGALTLKVTSGQTIYKLGELATISVFADSGTEAISAFDVVLPLAKSISYVEAKSLDNSFDLYPKIQEGKLAITGAKKITSKQSVVFSNNPIATISLRASEVGVVMLTPEFSKGATDDSNLITEQTEDILRTVSGVRIGVGSEVSVTAGKKVAIDNKKATVEAVEITADNPDCRDCIAGGRLRVAKNGKTEEIVFKVGGIAGFSESIAEVEGYLFEFAGSSDKEVTIRYAPF